MPNAEMKTLTIGDTTYEIVDEVARESVGDLSDLTTQVKTDLVSAINEAAGSNGVVVTVTGEGTYKSVSITYAEIRNAVASGKTVVVRDDGVIPYPYVGMMSQNGVPALAFGVSATYEQTAVLNGYLILSMGDNTKAVYVDQMTAFYSKAEIDSKIGDIETLLSEI